MKSEKRQITESIEQKKNPKRMRTVEGKKNFKYFGLLEGSIKQEDIKEKNRKDFLRWTS